MDRAERIRRSVELEFQSLDREERRRERRRLERRLPSFEGDLEKHRFKRRAFPRSDMERRFEHHHP